LWESLQVSEKGRLEALSQLNASCEGLASITKDVQDVQIENNKLKTAVSIFEDEKIGLSSRLESTSRALTLSESSNVKYKEGLLASSEKIETLCQQMERMKGAKSNLINLKKQLCIRYYCNFPC
jgi:hypothetical protein